MLYIENNLSIAERLKKNHAYYQAANAQVGLQITKKCPVGCAHCVLDCTATEDTGEKIDYNLWIEKISKEQSINTVSITGGEPFFVFNDLLFAVKTISKYGLKSTVVTSCYWATDNNVSKSMIDRLVSAGISSIAVSVDKFHQKKIPIEYVIRVLKEAKLIGLKVYIHLTITDSSKDHTREKDDLDEYLKSNGIYDVNIHTGGVIKAGRANNIKVEGIENSTLYCPSIALLIRTDGKVAACCGAPLNSNSPLLIGDINRENFTDIYNRFRNNPFVQFLQVEGVKSVFEKLKNAGLLNDLKGYDSPMNYQICELCQVILAKESCRNFLCDELKKSTVRNELGLKKMLLFGDYCLLIDEE